MGKFVWEFAREADQELVKSAVSRVLGLREAQYYEAADCTGVFYRIWMWPVDLGPIAVSILSSRIPIEVNGLSSRERDCLQLLAQGRPAGAIARELDVSLSTVHTHIKRARAKLGLANIESLIGFAARYC
jgi:DNA-binding CsgD family transcriptional regulator